MVANCHVGGLDEVHQKVHRELSLTLPEDRKSGIVFTATTTCVVAEMPARRRLTRIARSTGRARYTTLAVK